MALARVLIATTPADGHVNPLLRIAGRLTRRGHEVRWYTGQIYRDAVARTGAGHEPMVAAYDFGGLSREEAFPSHAGLQGLASFKAGLEDVFYRTAPDQMHDLMTVLQRFPADVIVSDDMCYGACFAAEKTGVPLVWVGNSVYILGSRDTAPLGHGLPPSSSVLGRLRNRALALVSDHLALRSTRRGADQARAAAGLPRLATGAMENIARRPSLYLVGTVESFEYPRSDLFGGTHFVGALDVPEPRHEETPSWWGESLAGKRVVLVTQGTVANDVDRLLLPAIRALADEPVTAVVITGHAELSPAAMRSLPANVRVERFVPYGQLMPHVDAMITNGGFNGVNSALAHGVPLVVAAGSEEKGEIAARVKWSGTGVVIRDRSPSPQRIREAVTDVFHEPRYRRNACRLRAEHRRTHGPRRSVDLIEGLVGTASPAGGVR